MLADALGMRHFVELLDTAGPQLRIVANMAVGYDNIDVLAATRHKIPVSNTPDVLSDATAVDYLGREPRFMMVYQLYNIGTHQRLRIKAAVDESDARIDTVSCVWATANWLERECYDLMGIVFNNHPDPRRILMPADWVGHPLRKDYPVQGPDREPYQGRLQ